MKNAISRGIRQTANIWAFFCDGVNCCGHHDELR